MKKLNDAVDRFAYHHPNFGLLPYLGFNWGQVLHLQLWRLVSFIFVPDVSNIFYLIINLYFYYFIGNLLEREWGTPKFNLYYLSGVVLTILVGIIGYYTSGSTIYGAYYVTMSMFLAFAALYPDAQVLLFFIIPIKIKWLAIVDGVFFAVEIARSILAGNVVGIITPVLALLNFAIFITPHVRYLRQKTQYRHSSGAVNFRRTVHQAQQQQQKAPYHHKCAVCGRTDTDYPDLQFRYCSKCAGYHCFCQDHIFSHVHFTEE